MARADGGQVVLMAGDVAPVLDAFPEQRAALQVAGRVAVAAGAGLGEGEVDHRAQRQRGRQGVVLAQLLGSGPHHPVLGALQFAAPVHHQLGGLRQGRGPAEQKTEALGEARVRQGNRNGPLLGFPILEGRQLIEVGAQQAAVEAMTAARAGSLASPGLASAPRPPRSAWS